MLSYELLKDKSICVATSGGADSTALLHYLKSKANAYGFRIFAVHCEHGIRGKDSVEDMQFVQELCKAWQIPLLVYNADCKALAKEEKISLETAARNFRRKVFLGLIHEGKADFIATAHHQGDEAETVLFRLIRGTSLSGAKGMTECDGVFLRPFLGWSKADIIQYVKENNLSYKEDASNLDTQYSRNKLRIDVLPKLEEVAPSAAENIARFARLAAEDDLLLYTYAENLLQLDEKEKRATVAFSSQAPLFRRACVSALKFLGVERDYTAAHLDAVNRLQGGERGSVVHLTGGVRAEKTSAGIVFYLQQDKADEVVELCLQAPFGENGFDGGRYEVKVLFSAPNGQEEYPILRLDADKLPKDAIFRFRKEGDSMQTFGGGRKSLKKLFNEKKLPVTERAHVPLIAQAQGKEVYAVCGVEISQGVKITDETVRTAYVVLRRKHAKE